MLLCAALVTNASNKGVLLVGDHVLSIVAADTVVGAVAIVGVIVVVLKSNSCLARHGDFATGRALVVAGVTLLSAGCLHNSLGIQHAIADMVGLVDLGDDVSPCGDGLLFAHSVGITVIAIVVSDVAGC